MTLHETAHTLVASGKGILAADESMPTCDKRFDVYGIPKTEDLRRKWRQLLFTTPGVEKGLSGVILFDETLRQKSDEGIPFADLLVSRGIIPGIKVDEGTEALASSPEEKVTKGVEGLPKRLPSYVALGARFAKWRAVIRIDDAKHYPTDACLEENARRLARYALECQRVGMVPILEPEVLLDGTHSLERSEEVLTNTLRVLFEEVRRAGVDEKGVLLKSSMALPGKESGMKASPQEIAEATLRAFSASVPKEVPGIVFLSGGQTPEEATVRLNEIVLQAKKKGLPWRITFSYSRALQEPVMAAWRGSEENVTKAQQVFSERVAETARASEGKL